VASVTGTTSPVAVSTTKDLGLGGASNLAAFAEGTGIAWIPCGFSASGASFAILVDIASNGYWAIDAILAEVNARESSRP
jgi:hypothetical protein